MRPVSQSWCTTPLKRSCPLGAPTAIRGPPTSVGHIASAIGIPSSAIGPFPKICVADSAVAVKDCPVFRSKFSANDTLGSLPSKPRTCSAASLLFTSTQCCHAGKPHLHRHCSIVPAVNQVEVHPLLVQKELREYCKARGIVIQAYASLGNGSRVLINHELVCAKGMRLPLTPPLKLGKSGFQLREGGGGCSIQPPKTRGEGGFGKRDRLTGPLIRYFEIWRRGADIFFER